VWIETAFASGESGRVYGCGLDNFGVPLDRVVIVRVPRPVDALWAMQEALGCRGIAAVIAALTDAPDLTATRRLSLTVRDSGGLGLLVMHRIAPQPSAALTRWQVAAARSRSDRFGGLGLTAFDLRLTKNRHGPGGRWTIAWDHHERAFVDPLSVAVAQAAFDRSDHALRPAGRALRRVGRALRRA
jgi:protein ImuA